MSVQSNFAVVGLMEQYCTQDVVLLSVSLDSAVERVSQVSCFDFNF